MPIKIRDIEEFPIALAIPRAREFPIESTHPRMPDGGSLHHKLIISRLPIRDVDGKPDFHYRIETTGTEKDIDEIIQAIARGLRE